MKKTIAILLVVCLALGLCACTKAASGGKNDGKSSEKTEIELVHDAVELRRVTTEVVDRTGTTIGSGLIKSVQITITNTEKVDDLEYMVNGQIIKTDVYGRKWLNYFDCTVVGDEGEDASWDTEKNTITWDAEEFDYLKSSWEEME